MNHTISKTQFQQNFRTFVVFGNSAQLDKQLRVHVHLGRQSAALTPLFFFPTITRLCKGLLRSAVELKKNISCDFSKMTAAFLAAAPLHHSDNAPSVRAPIRVCPAMQSGESRSKGFKKPSSSPPPSEANMRRQAAANKYDEMAAAGMPEYTVWMRLKEGGTAEKDEKMPWLPVGCISVPRSSQVADALFDVEKDLMQGAVRLYPKLSNEPRENIEFGYQLRDFDDEEIRVAERSPTSGFQATLTNFFRKLQNPLNPR